MQKIYGRDRKTLSCIPIPIYSQERHKLDPHALTEHTPRRITLHATQLHDSIRPAPSKCKRSMTKSETSRHHLFHTHPRELATCKNDTNSKKSPMDRKPHTHALIEHPPLHKPTRGSKNPYAYIPRKQPTTHTRSTNNESPLHHPTNDINTN